MDNIQKLVIGVLSVAGMLAMLVPSADSVGLSAAPPPPPPIAIENPPPAQTVDLPQSSEPEEAPESELTDDDVFGIGEGAIDGSPVGGSFDDSSSAPPPISYDPGTFSAPSAPNGATANTGGGDG